MSNDEVNREIDGAAEMFAAWEEEFNVSLSPSIHFTGGEPLLYQGLWDSIAHARQCGFQVAILTNGTLITADDAKQAAALGIEDLQISLEGPPGIHDGIRGNGSFAAAAAGVRRLREAGNNVSANMTLSRLNFKSIEETVRIARDAGFNSLGVSRLIPCGSGESLLDRMLDPQEAKEAFEQALGLSSATFGVASGDPLAGVAGGVRPAPESPLSLSGCSAGFSGVTVTSDGSVMPCRRIGLRIGNLHKTPLRQIWSSSRLLWRLRRRESYLGKCGQCDLWPSCRGCRAVAYAFTRSRGTPDLFADDPQCWRVGR